jgi:radical SAM superfamily enzyme YgiQ (UPF0313 family)
MKTFAEELPIQPVKSTPRATHPLGSKARVLLTSVFGPYAQDDEYGSRAMNPMELYHNQVTRVQGPFSLRMFHRSWGLMLIQANISAPCVLLDFPTLDRFIEEIRDNHYDVIGISSIIPNQFKVKKMVELIRQYQPKAVIVVGGHIANFPNGKKILGADHVVKGEGVRWFREFFGEDSSQPIRHPRIISGIGTRNMGITVKDRPGDVAATVIPSVGCPMGCNFCSTSAMFGGKGKSVNFYETGEELFDIMCQFEESMHVRSFFIMDENFLLYRKRAMGLLDLMKKHNKAWALYVFSSANALKQYTMEELVELGISWVWLGLEGENSRYSKLQGTDAHELVRNLRAHGIRVMGSTIIGLETHTPENIDRVIDYAAAYNTDFHQFMLYSPIPGTPLYEELLSQGRMKDESEYHQSDIHGQYIFNYRHPHIKNGQETEFVLRAFQRDFEVNGPSVLRIVRTTLTGWQRYKTHPDARIRARFAWEARELGTTFAAAVAGARLFYRNNPAMHKKMSQLLADLKAEFGWKARFYAAVGGRYVLWNLHQEEKRLASGWTYEPPTFYERNAAVEDHQPAGRPAMTLCQPIICRVNPAKPDAPHATKKPLATAHVG